MNRCEQLIGVQLGACRSRPLQGLPRLAASLHIPLIADAPQGLIQVHPLELCAVLPGAPDNAQAELNLQLVCSRPDLGTNSRFLHDFSFPEARRISSPWTDSIAVPWAIADVQ